MEGGFQNPPVGNQGILLRPAIRSPNFVKGSAGWSINRDGSAEFDNVVIRNGQVISGTELFYNGAPALGNLIASISAAAGTDSFGNAYVQGFGSYVTSGFEAVLGGSNLVAFHSRAPADTQPRWIVGRDGLTQWGSGSAAADVSLGRSAAAQLGLTAGAFVSTAGTAANPSKFLTDTWQTLGTLAGYTVVIGRFRLTTDNCVELDIKANGGGAQAQTVTFSVTLPAAYRPATQHDTLPMGTTKAIAAGDIWPRLLVSTAGAVTVNASPNSATTIACCVRVPLD